MKQLWAPWRLEYIKSADEEPGCVFCDAFAGGDEDSLIVCRAPLSFVILNKFPYNNGHLMVVPNRHIASLREATAAELSEIMVLAGRAEAAIHEAYAPHGLNMGINLGKPAGAGILDHLHMHVVPRWNGDTNFMTVVGNVRVVPESLDATKAKLEPIFARLAREGQ